MSNSPADTADPREHSGREEASYDPGDRPGSELAGFETRRVSVLANLWARRDVQPTLHCRAVQAPFEPSSNLGVRSKLDKL